MPGRHVGRTSGEVRRGVDRAEFTGQLDEPLEFVVSERQCQIRLELVVDRLKLAR
jgi:hypothetical protein